MKANEIERRLHFFSKACRQHGIKTTHQRTEIYRELASTEKHPDAETIYVRVRRRIPAISLDTVYRTLRQLEEREVISRLGVFGEKMRFDANTDPHHHFICTRCGFVGDLYNGELTRVPAPRDVEGMGTVHSVHIELRGVCNACQKKRFNRKEGV
ncbi:MAG: Fur family transcriptional regulator [Candidatus Zixiibacteriota bacterium]